MSLTHEGVFTRISDPLRDVFYAFDPLRMLLRVFMFFAYRGHFCHFWMYFWTTCSLAIRYAPASSSFSPSITNHFFFSFSSSPPSLHILSNSFYKNPLPLSHSLTNWLSTPLQSQLLSKNSHISFHDTQVQEEFLLLFYRCIESHSLEWSGKANWGSFLDLQIIASSF